MKNQFYRWTIRVAIIALIGLLCIQVYWFKNAYDIQEAQFNDKVNLSLRAVGDGILKAKGKDRVEIAPVKQLATNSFLVEINESFEYTILDSLVRKQFRHHNIAAPFALTVYDAHNSLIVGNQYNQGASSPDNATCVSREQTRSLTTFEITFPQKRASIVGS